MWEKKTTQGYRNTYGLLGRKIHKDTVSSICCDWFFRHSVCSSSLLNTLWSVCLESLSEENSVSFPSSHQLPSISSNSHLGMRLDKPFPHLAELLDALLLVWEIFFKCLVSLARRACKLNYSESSSYSRQGSHPLGPKILSQRSTTMIGKHKYLYYN